MDTQLVGTLREAISQGLLPRYLYKYRSMGSVEVLLNNNSMWFSSPLNFNDPFDCQIVTATNNTENEIFDYLISQRLSYDEAKKNAKRFSNSPLEWGKLLDEKISYVVNSSKICCFTTNEKNILMWSHYTDSHKGVCLKFDVLEDLEFFLTPMRVNYRNDYPIFNYLRDTDKLLQDLVLSKSQHWSYEDEIRVIKMNTKNEIIFNKKSLVEIIFGCNCSEDDREKIKILADDNSYNVGYKRSTVSNKIYELDILNV